MSVEFIGYVGNKNGSESLASSDKALDLDYVEALAKLHEYGDFDRVLLAFHSDSPESILVGQHIAEITQRLKLMIAHRPGFTAPTIAARQFATLDHISRGRAAIHVITGGNDQELKADGDALSKAQRYARSSEYLDILRATWFSTIPFNYHGEYYQVEGAYSSIKPYHPDKGIPVYFGGASHEAVQVAGKQADIYALWGESKAQVQELLGRVRQAATAHGRDLRFSLSLRPIIAYTEEAAWAKAEEILERAKVLRNGKGYETPQNAGSLRLLEAAKKGVRVDERLWTGIAALTGARGNSTSLVGTPEQVSDALLDYYDLGISTFLIRGFEPLVDTIAYGRDLLPLVREKVADRDSQISPHSK